MRYFVFLVSCIALLISLSARAQVGIGTSAPSPSSILELQSSSQGLLLPRLTTTQLINVRSPEAGLVVYNLDSNDVFFFNGSCWLGMHDLSDTLTWQCGDTLVDDRDQAYYPTVLIGSQCWMQRNLNVGTMINGFSSQSDNSLPEKYCYNNDPAMCETYGGLYQWDEMMQYSTDTVLRGICPSGWHIPTDTEWKILEGTVDSYYGVGDPEWDNVEWRGTDAGGNLKETGTTHWKSENIGATNSSGFTALPTGYNTFGTYANQTEDAIFWTTRQHTETLACGRLVKYYTAWIARYRDYTKAYGFSVRCVCD